MTMTTVSSTSGLTLEVISLTRNVSDVGKFVNSSRMVTMLIEEANVRDFPGIVSRLTKMEHASNATTATIWTRILPAKNYPKTV